jgi:hypothetical protein
VNRKFALFKRKKQKVFLVCIHYEILIYYVIASFVQGLWKDTEYRI